MPIGCHNRCCGRALAILVAAAVALIARPAGAQTSASQESAAIAKGGASSESNLSGITQALAAKRTWRRITIGTWRNPNALRAALDAARIHLGDSADEILGRPAFAYTRTPVDLDLVVVKASDLGLTGHTPLAEIHRRAAQLGLELCPPETAPVLRLAYRDQPVGEFLHVAMTPVATYAGDLIDLTLANGGAGLILIGGQAHPDTTLHASVKFVFVRPARVAGPDTDEGVLR